MAASTSKSGAPTVDCDLAIKSIPFQQLCDPYASGEVLEGSDTDSDDELTKQIWRAQNNFTKELGKIVSPLHIDDSMQETVDEIQYQIQLLCEKLTL
ncbi:hypothetical protein CPC16_003183 [Podila verticillata]|nr:hypothetical protein CPC16_003183 [Podila verticillata]